MTPDSPMATLVNFGRTRASESMEPTGVSPGLARNVIAAMVTTVVAVHLLVAVISPYGFHRDEFLYMAMGRNLRLFAMDFPPLIALLSEVQRSLFSDALWSLRLAPALAHGALVLLTALLAWRLGGRMFAQVLAMTAAASAPLYLRAASLFQPVVLDQLWWTLACYALVRVAAQDSGSTGALRYWVLFGVACGFGLLTKFSILFLGAATLGALLISRREWLRTPGPWVAAALTALIGAPSWVGQLQLGMPVVSQMSALQASQLDRITYGQFAVELVLMHGPGAFLLAAAGAAALLVSPRLQRWRVVGWVCLLAILIILVLRGKPYYVGPVFPALYAAGAVLLAGHLARVARRPLRHAASVGAVVLILSWSTALLPLALPLFPPQMTARFAVAVGITSAITTNQGVVMELPQDYADLLGWETKVSRIAQVYHSLPDAEKEQVVILASNYGQAGAIDFYGPIHRLPPARAPIGSYWFWGPGDKPGNVIIKVGGERTELEGFCRDLALATRIEEPWVVPEERNLAIWICRGPARTLQEIWPAYEGQN